jgi:hypothetical protein
MCSTVQDPLVALADTDDSYHQLSSFCDQKYQLMWYYMHAAPRPCFTRKLLIKLWRFRGASIERLRRRSTRAATFAIWRWLPRYPACSSWAVT